MAQGIDQIISLNDPVGEIVESTLRPNGLEICKKRVPLGVIGIIYESRPNVTADAFGLCFKTGNAVILKGRQRCHSFKYSHCFRDPQSSEDYAKEAGLDGEL